MSNLTAFIFAVVAFVFTFYVKDFFISSPAWSNQDIRNVAEAWNAVVKKPPRNTFSITFGWNGCVDLIVNGTETLRNLQVTSNNKPVLHSHLESLEELEELFSYSFINSAGVERHFLKSGPFKKVTGAATQVPNAQWFIGGNAALMAQTVVSDFPEFVVNLVAPVGPRLKSLLQDKIEVCSTCDKTEDEIHLILEYHRGEVWGSSEARVSNRMITSYDRSNSEAQLLNDVFITAQKTGSQLIIISGLHMLEAESPEFKMSKLSELATQLKQLSRNVAIHLELASMSDKTFVKQIALQILPHITSLGLNEQELSLLLESLSYSGDRGTSNTRYSLTSNMLNQLLQLFSYHPTDRPDNRLTRIHFHCLTYHMIASVMGTWSNTDAAVAAGTQRAVKQACEMSQIDPDRVELRVSNEWIKLSPHQTHQYFNTSHPVISWTHDRYYFTFSPSLVCKIPLKTVGLGDAISATGLLYSLYNTES